MKFATSVATGVLLALAATAALADTQATSARRTSRLDLLAGHRSADPATPAAPRGAHGLIDADLDARDSIVLPADVISTRPSVHARMVVDSVVATPEMKVTGVRPTSLVADMLTLDLNDEDVVAKMATRPRSMVVDSVIGEM